MSLASFTAKKVLGIKLWVILLIVVLLLVGGLVIVRRVYNKLSNRKRAVVEVVPTPIETMTATVVQEQPPVQETKDIEEVVKNALDADTYTVDVKEVSDNV